MLVQYGPLTQLMIIICWNQYKIELHAGFKASAQKWSKSTSVCIAELRWPSLKICRSYISIWTLYSILHKRTAINFSNYFEFNVLATRLHSLTLNLVSSTINAFRHSFFVTTPFLRNSIPFEILSQSTARSFQNKLKHYLFGI